MLKEATPFAPRAAVFGRDGARRRATPLQYAAALALMVALGWGLSWRAGAAFSAVQATCRVLFAFAILMRLATLTVRPRRGSIEPLSDAALPAYSIILPLYREAAVVPGLVAALFRIDYPRDRLQLLFALEADDLETQAAVRAHAPRGARVLIAPRDGPRTKPHACNVALAVATGEVVVVYDAEDRPHPGQLREAAARFAAEGAGLVCLQAPLRVHHKLDLLGRQFALEYAAQFEVTLPAFARAGVAFPLGGTSNHFRADALRAVGGWDPYNVTEDADVGLKLGACGGRVGMLTLPTGEPPPPSLNVWQPQRTRWIKGHLHTWIVHMRRPLRGGLKGFLTLQATLGMNVATALLHGPMAVGVAACLLLGAVSRAAPAIAPFDAGLLLAGWASAAASITLGARRAGFPVRATDVLAAPLYWPLQSLAAIFAVAELVVAPHRWNKTPHEAEDDDREAAVLVTTG